MFWMCLLSAAIGYFIGCISFGYITGKILKNRDIRDVGSGNAGTANVIRNFGWVPGLITFAGDVLKGVAAALIGLGLAKLGGAGLEGAELERAVWAGACIGGLMAVIGHILPFYLKFKGGKGVATSFGVFLVIMPWQALIVFTLCIILIAATKTMSVGSLAGTFTMAGLSWIFFLTRWWLPIASIWVPITSTALFVLVFYSHRANIKRLAEGKETQL